MQNMLPCWQECDAETWTDAKVIEVSPTHVSMLHMYPEMCTVSIYRRQDDTLNGPMSLMYHRLSVIPNCTSYELCHVNKQEGVDHMGYNTCSDMLFMYDTPGLPAIRLACALSGQLEQTTSASVECKSVEFESVEFEFGTTGSSVVINMVDNALPVSRTHMFTFNTHVHYRRDSRRVVTCGIPVLRRFIECMHLLRRNNQVDHSTRLVFSVYGRNQGDHKIYEHHIIVCDEMSNAMFTGCTRSCVWTNK